MGDVSSTTGVRPFEDRDRSTVIELVEADRLIGQPPVTGEMLADTLAGRSQVDEGWWEELDHPLSVDVVENEDGIAAVVSYATRSRDGAGVILWLHGRERQVAVTKAVDHVLHQLADCPVVHAFDFATPLGLGLEALPVRHRPATVAALVERGFEARDLWRYMHRPLPAPDWPTADNVEITPGEHGQEELKIYDGDQLLAEATIGVPVPGIGVLWWISVEGQAQCRGLGRRLLGSAMGRMVALGATEAILYVDDDEPPGGERDRFAANRLYEAAGFTEIDRLHSFQLRR